MAALSKSGFGAAAAKPSSGRTAAEELRRPGICLVLSSPLATNNLVFPADTVFRPPPRLPDHPQFLSDGATSVVPSCRLAAYRAKRWVDLVTKQIHEMR